MSRRGLPCLYNCADSVSPDLDQDSCSDKWESYGSLVWDYNGEYPYGTVVEFEGNFYTAVYGKPAQYYAPDTQIGQEYMWELCVEPTTFSDNTNRLDAYLAYLAEQCRDCGLPSTAVSPDSDDVTGPPTPDTIDGQPIIINGTVEL